MIVPWQDVTPDTLRNLVEEFVTRDGTDYGERETDMETRVRQVMAGLRSGQVLLWFDEVTEEVGLVSWDQLDSLEADRG